MLITPEKIFNFPFGGVKYYSFLCGTKWRNVFIGGSTDVAEGRLQPALFFFNRPRPLLLTTNKKFPRRSGTLCSGRDNDWFYVVDIISISLCSLRYWVVNPLLWGNNYILLINTLSCQKVFIPLWKIGHMKDILKYLIVGWVISGIYKFITKYLLSIIIYGWILYLIYEIWIEGKK